MATWPAALPSLDQIEDYAERPPELKLRSAMDAGPPKQRRRFSSGPTEITGWMLMTKAQVATLLTFHDTTLARGALRFEGVHPRTLAAVTMGFVSPPQPRHRANAGGLWRVDLHLELW